MNPIATMRILWAALLSSIGLFAVVIVLLPAPENTAGEVELLLFAGLAASSAVMSFVVPRLLHANAVRAAAPEITEVPDPDAPSGFAEVKRVQVFKDAAGVRREAFRLYQTYMIIGCALSETVALFGVVLDQRGHAPTLTLPFVAISAVLVALRYPVEAKAIGLFESVAKARLS